jgi:hypothetical protein
LLFGQRPEKPADCLRVFSFDAIGALLNIFVGRAGAAIWAAGRGKINRSRVLIAGIWKTNSARAIS